MSNFYTNNGAAFSSDNEEWETPKKLFDELNAKYNFTLDPCSNGTNAKCEKFYTKEQNGLIMPWSGERVFCNPPYGRNINKWVEKAYNESDNCFVCMLIPARTDTRYFHDYIYHKARVDFLRGRLKFEKKTEYHSKAHLFRQCLFLWVMIMSRFYDWDRTLSYQTGTQGEICLVLGAKDIGKTFGLRKKCVERFIKYDELFCEICRTNAERDEVIAGYFDKLQYDGFFSEYIFKIERKCGYIARKPIDEKEKPQWRLICYFVALTNFQREKKRTYKHVRRFIFDEAIIDTKDRYHRYLKDEFLILANLLDSISRQQPNTDYQYNVYMLGNAVDLTCPYLRYNGISKLPKFGYSFYKDKTVLLHYVEPWNADERKARTLVGRMLKGNEESKVIFDNVFQDTTGKEIQKKTSEAKYKFAFKWSSLIFAIWIDQARGLWFVTSKLPKGSKNVYTLTKKDSSINYQAIKRADPLAKLLNEVYYIGGLRYESPHLREAFFEVLEFLGIR